MPHVTSFRRPPSGRAETLQRALDFHRQGKLDKAGRLYQQLLKVNPDHFDALHLLGVLRGQEGRNDVGFELISRALTVRPHSAEALGNLANVLQGLGRHDEAVATYDKVLAINPRDPKALNNRGNALQALKKYEEALVSHDKALAINARDPEALNNRGATLAKLHRHEEAVASFDRALAMIPDYADALCNRGLSLALLHRHSEAIASYDRALAVRPHQAEDWLGRGVLLSQLKRFDQALASYEKALGINPDLAEAWLRLGEVSFQLGRYDGALAALDRALLIEPRLESTEGFRVHVKMLMCDWTDLETECLQVITAVRQGIRACDPFPMLAIESSPADQLNCARLFVTDQVFVPQRSIPRRMADVNHRVRIAYLSADFKNHAIAHLVAELFELHDRTRFDVIGISFGPDDGSEIRRRLVKAFDQFHDVRSKSDLQVAQLINESSVGIAVDLTGHTGDSRLGILACRPAPSRWSI